MSRAVLVAVLWLGTLGLPHAARADTCGPADGIAYVLPVAGSTEVHPEAFVVVRYTLEAALADDTAPVVELEGPDGAVEHTSSWDGRAILLVTLEPLARGARYTATASWPGAEPWTWTFETTTSEAPPDPPVLGPALSARSEYLGGGPEGDDPCGPVGLERYRVHLELPAAQGSSGPGNLEYVAFETRGRGVDEPTEVARAVDEAGSEEVGVDFYLRADGVHGEACFRVLAVDVTGVPSGTTDEACTRLREGPFFRSMCGVTPASPSESAELVVVLLLLWLRGATFRT